MWLSTWIILAALCIAVNGQLLYWMSKRMMHFDSSYFVPGCLGYVLSLGLFCMSALTLCVGIVFGIVEWMQ